MPLYASIEVEPDAETYRRIAAQLIRDKVDGIMMFNYFTSRQSGREPDFALLRRIAEQLMAANEQTP